MCLLPASGSEEYELQTVIRIKHNEPGIQTAFFVHAIAAVRTVERTFICDGKIGRIRLAVLSGIC